MSVVNFANDFEIFRDAQLGSVRAVADEKGMSWFVAKDVCDVLEIKNPSDAVKRLDDDEKYVINPHKFTLVSNEGEKRMGPELNIINESGLYTLVLNSRKPQAKEFKKWLTKEVIPAIRQHGGYVYGQEKLPEKELRVFKDELSDMAAMVKKLRARRHELIGEVSKLKDDKRKLKKNQKALGEYADLFEDMFEKTHADYEKAVDEIEVLKYKIEKLTHPERIEKEPKRKKIFITADGIALSEQTWCSLNGQEFDVETDRE